MSAPRKSGSSSADKIKLLVALGLFLIAGLVLAWYYDLLPGGGEAPPPPPTPQQQQQIEESQKIQQKESLRKDVTTGSS